MVSRHVPVHRLLLPVQGFLQHQLGELVAVSRGLHVEEKVTVGGDLVRAQRIAAHVRVEGALQRQTRPRRGALGDLHRDVRLREARRVVVNIHHFDLDPEKFQRVFQENFQMQQADGVLLADALPVDLLVDEQDPVLQVHLQVGSPGARHRLEPPADLTVPQSQGRRKGEPRTTFPRRTFICF
uniref:Uncharacterized protein n=1 Tax=Callorhinchus milii TaxID=7868 RepID=A0A4W3GYV1_CALMI